MKVTLVIPTIDTLNQDFTFHGKEFTVDEYGNMVMKHYMQYNNQINDMMVNGIRRPFAREVSNKSIKDNDYNKYECEAFVTDANGDEITEQYFYNFIRNGKMFIIDVDVNTNTLNNSTDTEKHLLGNDSESELRFWKRDSKLVRNDRTLDDITKLKTLPTRDLYISLDNNTLYKMQNCKIIEDYSNHNKQFHFAIIVEKIIR